MSHIEVFRDDYSVVKIAQNQDPGGAEPARIPDLEPASPGPEPAVLARPEPDESVEPVEPDESVEPVEPVERFLETMMNPRSRGPQEFISSEELAYVYNEIYPDSRNPSAAGLPVPFVVRGPVGRTKLSRAVQDWMVRTKQRPGDICASGRGFLLHGPEPRNVTRRGFAMKMTAIGIVWTARARESCIPGVVGTRNHQIPNPRNPVAARDPIPSSPEPVTVVPASGVPRPEKRKKPESPDPEPEVRMPETPDRASGGFPRSGLREPPGNTYIFAPCGHAGECFPCSGATSANAGDPCPTCGGEIEYRKSPVVPASFPSGGCGVCRDPGQAGLVVCIPCGCAYLCLQCSGSVWREGAAAGQPATCPGCGEGLEKFLLVAKG